MPLLDHFHPPLAPVHNWESFHARWTSSLSDSLNERLPARYFAEPQTHSGARVEVDVGTFEHLETGAIPSSQDGNTATLTAPAWAPPKATLTMPSVCPQFFEVKVFKDDGGARLVGVIELVSPANKDRSEHRRAFATKCASYLFQGISLVVVDIVTNRQANLHNEIVRVMEREDRFLLDQQNGLYTVAYWPLRRQEQEVIDLWPTSLALGQPLPTMPLHLGDELCLPVELETTYVETCRRLKLP